jgi:TonB family protein
MKNKQRYLSFWPHLAGWLLAAAVGSVPSLAHAQTPPSEGSSTGPRLTKPPRLTGFVAARYPESERSPSDAKAPRPPVTVVLRLSLDAEGTVTSAEIVTSGGVAFDENARRAARLFRFDPAEIDGKKAAIRILYRYQFTERFERREQPDLRGTVRTASGTGAAGVVVSLDTGETTTTDATGAFVFREVTEGRRTVTLRAPGAPVQSTEEELTRGRDLDAVYTLTAPPTPEGAGEADDAEVVITAPRLRKDVVSTVVPASEGRTLAGTQGDVLRVVENLPGVGRSAAGSGQLVVWGAAPTDTRVYLDGVRIPSLYHLGGLRSVVHGDLVKSIDLSPGGYGAAYGRALGGLVLIEKKELFDRSKPAEDDAFHGSAAIDTIDSAVYASAPLGSNARLSLGGRRSHLAPLIHAFSDDGFGQLVPLPRFFDGLARLGVRVGAQDELELGTLVSADEVVRALASKDPLGEKRETRRQGFSRIYGRWTRASEHGRLAVIPSLGTDRQLLASRFGGVETFLEQEGTVLGLRVSYETKLSPRVGLLAGFDGESVTTLLRRRGSIGSPPREGDARVFGQAPADRINVDQWSVTQASLVPFAEVDWSPLDALHILPGLRVEPSLTSASRRTPAVGETPPTGAFRQDASLSPRLALRTTLGRQLVVKAAVGLYRQPASPEDLSASVGNPLLGPGRARHALLGTEVGFDEHTTLAVTSFFTEQDHLVVRSALSAPLLAEGLVQTGEGRTIGSQMLLRRSSGGRFFGWLSYTIARSERRSDGAAGAAYRLFDFDQTHVLTALGTFEPGRDVTLSSRLRYATGLPRTPVVGTFYDSRRDLEQPLFGPLNTTRLPGFFSLDVRLAKRWRLAPFEVEAFVEVQNATNRKNPEEWVYAADYRSRTTLTGLPLLPSTGARWSF